MILLLLLDYLVSDRLIVYTYHYYMIKRSFAPELQSTSLQYLTVSRQEEVRSQEYLAFSVSG